MKILFLSRWFPYPTDNGSKLRIYHLLRGLAEHHEVHLISFADHPESAAVKEMEVFCRSVQAAQWKEFEAGSRRALAGLFSPTPRSLTDIYSPEMEEKIRQALASQRFDLVIPSQWQMTAYRHLFTDLPVLYEEIEVGVQYGHFASAKGAAARLRGGLTWMKYRHYLRGLFEQGQPCSVVSEEERRLLQSAVPGARTVHVIPNGVNIAANDRMGSQPPHKNSLIFTGSFRYAPNYQAMVWFTEKVLPLVQQQLPGVTLTITGDPAGLRLPEQAGVVQTGFVDDVQALIARSWISVVPLLVGGGTRLKILEAMSLKTPVISTSKGAEGLGGTPAEHLLIADSPEDFACQIVSVCQDAALRERLANSGYQFVRERFDWQSILPRFLEAVEQAARK